MSYQQHPGNGRHSAQWYPPGSQPAPNGNGGWLKDLTKGSLPLTVGGTLLYVAYMVGVNVGSYQSALATLQTKVATIEVKMDQVSGALAKMDVTLNKVAERPLWYVETKEARR